MKVERANRIIAEFMGGPYEGDSEHFDEWSQEKKDKFERDISSVYVSLDALVPVWEKLMHGEYTGCCEPDFIIIEPYQKTNTVAFAEEVAYEGTYRIFEADSKLSIQEAAAIATAKAILRLK